MKMRDHIALAGFVPVAFFALTTLALGQGAADELAFDARVAAASRQMAADARIDPGLGASYAVLMAQEYGTSQTEIVWALDRGIDWGRIGVLAYVQATTGRSFEELNADGADSNIGDYVVRMEMSHDKMAQSLEGLAARSVEIRNSRIFDRLRASRRVDSLPDLGAGFGLFQEALDLREIGPRDPIKVHTGSGFSGKSGTEHQ